MQHHCLVDTLSTSLCRSSIDGERTRLYRRWWHVNKERRHTLVCIHGDPLAEIFPASLFLPIDVQNVLVVVLHACKFFALAPFCAFGPEHKEK